MTQATAGPTCVPSCVGSRRRGSRQLRRSQRRLRALADDDHVGRVRGRRTDSKRLILPDTCPDRGSSRRFRRSGRCGSRCVRPSASHEGVFGRPGSDPLPNPAVYESRRRLRRRVRRSPRRALPWEAPARRAPGQYAQQIIDRPLIHRASGTEGATARGYPRHAIAALDGIAAAHINWADSKGLNEWERRALELSEERSKLG
jgi:hypothetical protein